MVEERLCEIAFHPGRIGGRSPPLEASACGGGCTIQDTRTTVRTDSSSSADTVGHGVRRRDRILVCGIAGYSLVSGRLSTALSPPRPCSPGSRNVARTPSDTPTAAQVTVSRCTSSSPGRARSSRSCRCRARDTGPRPRPRLHQGPAGDRGQQPSHSPRLGRGRPQRDHLQRRRDLRSPRPGPAGAGDDRRLRDHLRRGAGVAERHGRARAAPRRDGGRVDRRASSETLYLARGVCRPLWLGLGRREVFFASTRSTLQLVERALRMNLRMREVSEGRLLHLWTAQSSPKTACDPTRATSRSTCFPPCAPRTRASPASPAGRHRRLGLADPTLDLEAPAPGGREAGSAEADSHPAW